MLEALYLITVVIVTTLIGYSILKTVLHLERRPLPDELAISYGIGMGAVALEFLFFWLIKVRPTIINMILPWIIIFTAFFFVKRVPVTNVPLHHSQGKHSPFEKFLVCGITLEVFLSFFRALIRPIESYDSVAIYAVRAKVFHEAGAIPPDFFSKITKIFPNSGHPLMIPLNEAWIYKFLGSFNDLLVKAIFPLYFVALLIVFYFALRDFFDRKRSLLFTFLLATIPQFNRFSSVGYADFVLTFYFTAGFVYLFRWMKKENIGYLIVSAILFGFACWTKMEGWALFIAVVLILFIFLLLNPRRYIKAPIKAGVFFLIVILIGLPWILLVDAMGLENEAFQFKTLDVDRFISSFSNLDRCPRIVYEFQKQFFGPKKWNIIWIIFLALFVLNFRDIFRRDMKYITMLLVLIMCGYAYFYLLMPLKPGEPINIYISTNLSRLFIHFTPLCVYWLASLCREKGYLEREGYIFRQGWGNQ